ncbi:MAG TPA: hypothetical protein VMG36_07590 [Thermoplasmata archaeon]|nr:hypothetical protein [Thermoplasmata archaeon]
MVDLQETPAVPPFDPKGDVRAGYFIAGGLLIALGWGAGVALNLLLHHTAPAGGYRWDGITISRSWGAYAWATLLFGLGTGFFGTVLLALGRGAPKGRIVLPGVDY